MNIRVQAAVALSALCVAAPAVAQVITFDDAVVGSTSYLHDNVLFSTAVAGGFQTGGPGEPQAFIDGAGLGTGTAEGAELRVDFLSGQTGALGFGYAVAAFNDAAPAAVHFTLYDADNNVLADVTSDAFRGGSNFPENWLGITFSGTATYGLLDFNETEAFAYIVDNFTLGSDQPPAGGVPEPGSWLLMTAGFGLAGASLRAHRRGMVAA